ncbi:hypothetical protein SAMN02745181_2406 [Rubritalea squalenifaciens DSM 18772]|uniref:Uncharacterized protein n=1 Tax=Rubritalea squalenifaciens DSM 18772 TaxID=1123071 RepID=A0A1M6LIJ5_9BACT|nr:hypothetical protein [Rubritalea squalenifaciens]SHJ70992.1 hypothetical protein SAMN02745181_2406 [Rubritalea squalenifaciens DSM 18772]
MGRFIVGLIAGVAVCFVAMLLLGSERVTISKSNEAVPSEPFSTEGRYFLHSSVDHLIIEEREGVPVYTYERWFSKKGAEGSAKISPGDDWQPTKDWWIYTEDGVWFWIFDGKDKLLLERLEIDSTGIHEPSRRKLPIQIREKLPPALIEKYWPEQKEN